MTGGNGDGAGRRPDVARLEDAHHAGHGARGRRVDAEARVGVDAPHERHVAQVGHAQVVEKCALAAEKARIFQASEGPTDERGGHPARGVGRAGRL